MSSFDKVEEEITKILGKLDELKGEKVEETLEIPPNKEFGDIATNVCFSLSKKLKKPPQEIARRIASKIKIPKGWVIKKVEAKAGYVNFFLDYERIAGDLLKTILKENEKYGSSDLGKGKEIVIEYSAPNPNKPIHIGQTRNNFIGMSVGNILNFTGHETILVNWINDRGAHICKSLWGYLQFGRKDSKGVKDWKELIDEWHENPGRWLTPKDVDRKPDFFVLDYYVKSDNSMEENEEYAEQNRELLQEWENENPKVRALWKRMNDWAYEGWKETYERQGCIFNKYYYESDIYKRGKDIVFENVDDGIFFKSKQGTIVADLEKHGLPGLVVIRSDGTSLYPTADLALTERKAKDYPGAKFIWVVGSSQKLYFQQLFVICDALGIVKREDCHHLGYGMVYLPEGKMSSRKGRVILADDLMNEVHDLVEKEIEKRDPDLDKKKKHEISEKIALGAIKYAMLKIDAYKDFVFDTKEVVKFEGDTGPYLQYAHVRASKILQKAGKWEKNFSIEKLSEQEKELIKKLMEFPEVVDEARKGLAPHKICNYAHELSTTFSEFYHACHVLRAETKDLRNFRSTLTSATKIVLKNSLSLLGMETPEKM